tara:strand:+ start:239 stop:550 length:312 start_codon:yes stop_codon:yes gene_type:complete
MFLPITYFTASIVTKFTKIFFYEWRFSDFCVVHIPKLIRHKKSPEKTEKKCGNNFFHKKIEIKAFCSQLDFLRSVKNILFVKYKNGHFKNVQKQKVEMNFILI